MAPDRDESTASYISQKALIYRSSGPTRHQKAMNEASITLCSSNPDLLNDRQELITKCREYVHEQGFAYKKGKSRSRILSPSSEEEPVKCKRIKISASIRKSRIDELTDRIKDISNQVTFKEKRREQATNVHDYKQCDMLTEQMVELKREKNCLQTEVDQLKARQKRSSQYQLRKESVSDRSRSSTPISSAFRQSTSSDICSSVGDEEADIESGDNDEIDSGTTDDSFLLERPPR